MKSQITLYKLQPFANMLDAGRSTAAAYKVPMNTFFTLVLIGADGKIVYNGNNAVYTTGLSKGKSVFSIKLEETLKNCPGVLDLKDEQIPVSMRTAAHYFDLQQFNLLDTEVQRGLAMDRSKEAKEFSELLKEKTAELRKKRLQQIQDLAGADPLQAYREATAFVAAFPRSPETTPLRGLSSTLQRKPEVKTELDAAEAFQRVVVPTMRRTTTTAAFQKNLKPMLDFYLQTYAKAKYAEIVKSAVEAHRRAVQ